jgi:transposase
MPQVNRNNPKRGSASESRYSLMEFERDFPDDAACLDWLLHHRYPNGVWCPTCERITKHHRERKRTSYSCQFCGHRVHPMVGTIFENSATSLRLWFYAIYLMSSTRCGASAKHLERELGVTYKTAWRMAKQIRTLLDQDDDETLSGTVEVDEGYFGGQGKWKHQQGKTGRYSPFEDKSMVLAMAQRREGQSAKITVQVVDPKTDGHTLAGRVSQRVMPASTVFTDEAIQYWKLGDRGYKHHRVHHTQKVYVMGNVHTNTIEGFWSLVKRGISGAHHNVSAKYLQTYLDEFAFRYNNREVTEGRGMFDAFLNQIGEAETPGPIL